MGKMRVPGKHCVWGLLLLLALLQNVGLAKADGKMVMATFNDLDEVSKKTLQLVYREAFHRLGLEFVYKEYPGKRASVMANAGEVDGELVRSYEYGHAHPNLIRVEENPFTPTIFAAYTLDPTIALNGWESLRGTDYRVSYKRGVQRPQARLTDVVAPEKLSTISRSEQGIKKLRAGRVEVYIDTEYTMAKLIESETTVDEKLYKAGVMDIIDDHAYLHKKHKDVAEKLSLVLREMKEEGLIDRYIADGMKE